MAALITVLAVFDRKHIFYWHKVTLNTVVSVISTAAKAPIMFVIAESISQWKWIIFFRKRHRLIGFQNMDSASRGPWGSLKLLWSRKRKCVLLVRISLLKLTESSIALQLGALTTVMAIAIDPFSQQLIQYEQRSVKVPTSDASIARAQRYSRGYEFIVSVEHIFCKLSHVASVFQGLKFSSGWYQFPEYSSERRLDS